MIKFLSKPQDIVYVEPLRKKFYYLNNLSNKLVLFLLHYISC